MGYYSRRLAPNSRPFTGFCLPFGRFQYKRLPMGISTAPDEYQACMEQICNDLNFIVVYLDDVLVFSPTPEEHLEHLCIVFERLTCYDVTLNGKKCHILRQEVDYLGFFYPIRGRHQTARQKNSIHSEDRHSAKQKGTTPLPWNDQLLSRHGADQDVSLQTTAPVHQ